MKLKTKFFFNPAKEKNITQKCRLVIYDNVKKEFAHYKELESNEIYQISYDFLDPHFNYKYKYQVIEESKGGKRKWVDNDARYTRFFPEIVDDSGLKYLYLKPLEESNYLIICFQALQRKPIYNYVNQLEGINAHRIYIKEGYGKEKLTHTSLYLNENNPIPVADLVQKLVSEYAELLNIPKGNTIFIGCSQGGFGALYHGYKFGAGHIITGEPPIALGNLKDIKEMTSVPERFLVSIFENVSGLPYTKETQKLANIYLSKIISQSAHPYPRVKILTGHNENYKKAHLDFFLSSMADKNIPNIFIDQESYHEHNSLTELFYPYVLKTFQEIKQKNH